MGWPPTLTSGLGMDSVIGCRRLPSPPAMITTTLRSGSTGANRSSSRSSSTTTRWSSSTGTWRIERLRIRASASSRDTPAEATTGR